MLPASDTPVPCSRILPPVWFLLALGAMVGVHALVPIATLVRSPWNLAGIAIVIAGASLTLVADRQFGTASTPVRPTERSTALVTGGVFRLSRNPMYLGMVLFLAGIAAGLGTVTPWVVCALFVLWIQRCFIRPEEAALHQRFGQAFGDYQTRVRRWI